MAQNKKSFVLYSDLLKSIEHLTNEEKGILFNHLLEYVNDYNPILTDRLILTAWKPIELQLKRDLIKFEEVKAKRSDAGKESARLRALKNEQQNSTNSTLVEFVEQASTNSTDNVNVNVNVNDNVNDIINKEGKPSPTQKKEIDYNSFVDYYNGTCTNLPKVLKINQKRKNNIAHILKKFTKQQISDAMKKANESDFLTGKNQRGWIADFDFITKENNLIKIIEGSYDKGNKNNKPSINIDDLTEAVDRHFRKD